VLVLKNTHRDNHATAKIEQTPRYAVGGTTPKAALVAAKLIEI
jgi:hypothetical protein